MNDPGHGSIRQNNRAPISLIILTYNEEINIEHTLQSVSSWIGEIIIVDSFSTDQTLEICRKYTDKIYQNPFENQAQQFNWALDHVPLQNDWIMRLDADEMIPGELAGEIRRSVPLLSEGVTGVYLKRKVYFMERWIKHGDYYPRWFLRIFRKGKGRYEPITEEHFVLAEGRSVRLSNDFVDYNRKGLSFWIDKHNHWSNGEMLDLMGAQGEAKWPDGVIKAGLFGTQEQRIRWLMIHVYARFPLFVRPFAYFFYRYFICLGFLDGIEGLIFHFLQGCWYRFLLDAKIYEAKKFGMQFATTKREYTKTKPWE